MPGAQGATEASAEVAAPKTVSVFMTTSAL